ncbi:MAG: SPFH domain-containing protein [Desulfurococcaceae archaeon TW002]
MIDIVSLVILGLFLVIVLAVILSHLKIVPEYKRLVVFRLGKIIGVKGPGLVFLVPIIDSGTWIDLREMVLDIPPQTCITKDNAPVNIDLLIYMKVFDPELAVKSVQNFVMASTGIAVTTLRAIVGDLLLDDVLARRDYINQALRAKLDEVTDRWGIKITSVEIKEIKPPSEVQEAMIKQMAAERTKRAMILEAEGKKQSAILEAEGYRESRIKKAEGEMQAAILEAEGKKRALLEIEEAARQLTHNTLLLKYYETLEKIAVAPSSKILIPMEVSKFLIRISEFLEKE